MPDALAFDVFGTLVQVSARAETLEPRLGARAQEFAQEWRRTQIEHSFRRALMRQYADFTVCTRQALDFTNRALRTGLSESELEELVELQTKPSCPPTPT